MKILVIGAMHGNEPLGPRVVELFRARPQANINTVLANEKALAANCRFVRNDLNRSFPGDSESDAYERRRAAELLDICRPYDLVLDFHNTHCPDNDCGFVGGLADEKIYNIADWLGLDRIIVADYNCINKYAPNCLSIEVSLNSLSMDAAYWYKKITSLAKRASVPKASKVKKFRFVYRMTLEDKVRLRLDSQNLRAFIPIRSNLAEAMGVSSPAYPIFIDDKYTPYNYGGLLNRLS